jgi:hypothetical protein
VRDAVINCLITAGRLAQCDLLTKKLNIMYKFDEQALRRGISMGLGSQGIWTPELEDVMFDEITNKALRIHDVVGLSEQLLAYTEWLKKEGLLNTTVSKLIVKKYIGK